MGIGTLRRYHKPLTEEATPEAASSVEGTIDSAEEAQAAAEVNEAKLAEEQSAQADAANEHPDTTADKAEDADGSGADSVNPTIQEAGGVEENPAEPDAPVVPVTSTPSETPGNTVVTEGDLSVAEPINLDKLQTERADRAKAAGLNRGSSLVKWQTFAGDEVAPDASRDEIALHYLGAKPE